MTKVQITPVEGDARKYRANQFRRIEPSPVGARVEIKAGEDIKVFEVRESSSSLTEQIHNALFGQQAVAA